MATVIDGSASVTINNGAVLGITSGTAVASTSGTSIDFTGIPSWVKRITVMFSGVSTNGTSPIQIQLGDSGGVKTTGYAGATGTVATGGTGVSLYTTGFAVSNISAATVTQGSFIFSLLGSNSWSCQGSAFSRNDSLANISGTKTLSGTLDLVRITTVNGTDTFDAGSVNILYEG